MFIIAAAPPSSAPIITAPVARAASPTVTTGLVDVGRPVPLGPGPVWLPLPVLVLLDSEGLPVGIDVVVGRWDWLVGLGVSFEDSLDGVGCGWTIVCVDPGRDSVTVLVVCCPGCVTVVGCGCGGGWVGLDPSVLVIVTVWPTVMVRVWPPLVSMIVFVVIDVFSPEGLGLSGGFKQSSLCRRQRLSDGAAAVPSGPTGAGAGVGTGSAGTGSGGA